jgi:hypothetical protein
LRACHHRNVVEPIRANIVINDMLWVSRLSIVGSPFLCLLWRTISASFYTISDRSYSSTTMYNLDHSSSESVVRGFDHDFIPKRIVVTMSFSHSLPDESQKLQRQTRSLTYVCLADYFHSSCVPCFRLSALALPAHPHASPEIKIC